MVVSVQQVESHAAALARGTATSRDVSQKMMSLIGVVWDFVRRSGLKTDGHNVAIYLSGSVPFTVEAGARVIEPFESTDTVFYSKTPGGLAATAAHMGPYHLMGDTHTAIREWCAANGHALEGTNWEVYGHWDDNPANLRTDVYYLLR